MKKNRGLCLASDLAECAIFVTFMVIGTYISIPFYPVPLTFQTVVCVACGMLLGAKKGLISMAVYLFMGLIGIPVFANGGSGLAYVFKPSFGYIIGFVLAAFVAGVVRGSNPKAPFKRYLLAAISAFAVNYLVGITYFILIWIYYYGGIATWVTSTVMYNLIYMPKDLVLCVLAAMLCSRVAPAVAKKRPTVQNSGKSAVPAGEPTILSAVDEQTNFPTHANTHSR